MNGRSTVYCGPTIHLLLTLTQCAMIKREAHGVAALHCAEK